MPLILVTTQKQFDELHAAVDRKAETVRVAAQALRNLLIDHAVLVREARAKGSKVVEPALARQKQPLVR